MARRQKLALLHHRRRRDPKMGSTEGHAGCRFDSLDRIRRQKCVMNFDLIREEVLPLLELKEAADSWDRFLALRDRTLLRLSSTL